MAAQPHSDDISLFGVFHPRHEVRRRIHTLRPDERAYCEVLRFREKTRFRMFAIGYKIDHQIIHGTIRK